MKQVGVIVVAVGLILAVAMAKKHRDGDRSAGAIAAEREQDRAKAPERAAQAEQRKRDDAERQQRIAAAVAADPPLTATRCTHGAPRAVGRLGELSLTMGDEPSFDGSGESAESYLMMYLRVIGSGVDVVSAPSSGAPFSKRVGFEGPTATLVIDTWIDPTVSPDALTYRSGELVGRVLLWDPTAHAIVCGAHVTAHNDTKLTIVHTTTDTGGNTEDALSKARVDLVNEALNAGLGSLVEVAR